MNKKTYLIEIETSISSNELIFELQENLHHLEGANISILTNNKDISIKENITVDICENSDVVYNGMEIIKTGIRTTN
jgi:hypothetical protein